MKRADRLLHIVQLLRRYRRPVTAGAMAAELEVSCRTLYRDIADLMASGVPIRGEAGTGYVLGEGYDLPPLMFNADELEAIMLGLRWVERRGDRRLQTACADAVAKIAAVLPKELRPSFHDAPLLTFPSPKQRTDTIDVGALRSAIRTQSRVHIAYIDERGLKSERVIWPLAIAYFDLQRVVAAWCELREEFRHFRTDRIARMEVLGEVYPASRRQLMVQWREHLDHEFSSNHEAPPDRF